jgi:hypothetical protein
LRLSHKVEQSLYMSLGFQQVEAPKFQNNRHMKIVTLSALRTGRLYPSPPTRKYFWYSILLEAKSTPGPQCGSKDYVNENFELYHRESNPRPSDLLRSAVTDCATARAIPILVIMHGSVAICTLLSGNEHKYQN